ncbi:MAG: aminotransferase class III-fold pyridoxal phosphate-dependent enzyme [Nanoarchaeota archaeon]|nr:aminotransferase class III-fold pyridoxal phosphate-dependent enzyme [Nanoarchaeota archaeon]
MNRNTAVPKVRRISGPNARAWAEFHLKYAAPSTYVPEFIWDRSAPAIGPFCTDVDGNVIMDFVSHIASSPLGYNNPELISLMKKLSFLPDKYAGSDFIAGHGKKPKKSEIPTPSHLHHKIVEITKTFGFDCAYFSNTGTEAVENAIKICYAYRENNGYGITALGAFHGRTLGALSLNESKLVHKNWYPQVPKIITMPFPDEQDLRRWFVISKDGVTRSYIEDLMHPKVGMIDPDETAYVIIEPVQGEGGYNIADKTEMQHLFEFCHDNDIPIICDEIQAGMGRTGKWWCSEHYDVKPDVIASAKSLQVGATISKRGMFPAENGRISSTWGEGNAMASALGYKIIDIIQKKNLLHNATKQGEKLKKIMADVQVKQKQIINVRGIGLMLAFEMDTEKNRKILLQKCLKNGLLLAPCGHKTIRVLPPLDVTNREVDLFAQLFEKSAKRI